jgi:universal stress protein A
MEVVMIPPKRILVGVDFSECSRTALAFAARFAQHAASDLDVLHVQEPLLTAAARTAHVDLCAESNDELRRFIEATPPADASTTETFVVCGAPGQVLCTIAAREQADLLVVGAHGLSGATRWVFGSNTERVLRHAQMSVLVVPDGWQPPHPEQRGLTGLGPVIVAVDLTEPAYLAAHVAARIARLLRTRLTVLHVVPEVHVLERWAIHARDAETDAVRAARTQLDVALAPLTAIAPFEVRVVTGDIVGSLLNEAGNSHSPLLVLGRRRQALEEGAPGTVVSRALASLPAPMLIVHPCEGATALTS